MLSTDPLCFFNRRQNLDWRNGITWMLWRVISLTRLAFSQLIPWSKMLGGWESFFKERLMTKPRYILVNHHVLVWNRDITDLCSLGCCWQEFHLASPNDGLVKRREVSLLATTHFIPGFPYILEHNLPSASQRTQQWGQEDILSIAPQGYLTIRLENADYNGSLCASSFTDSWIYKWGTKTHVLKVYSSVRFDICIYPEKHQPN